MKSNKPTHEEITARAYKIFVERGCPEGRDLEHWLEAEAQLNAETSMTSPQPAVTMAAPAPESPKTATRQTGSSRKGSKTVTAARL